MRFAKTRLQELIDQTVILLPYKLSVTIDLYLVVYSNLQKSGILTDTHDL
jgi:hypothetical protein